MKGVKDKFDEVFNVEVDCWTYGIQNYPGEIFNGLIHKVVEQIAPSVKAAIEHHYPFNPLEVAAKFSRAAKYLVHEKEIAFSILRILPNPATLDEEGKFVLAQVIDRVEQAYGGALERLERKWYNEKLSKVA